MPDLADLSDLAKLYNYGKIRLSLVSLHVEGILQYSPALWIKNLNQNLSIIMDRSRTSCRRGVNPIYLIFLFPRTNEIILYMVYNGEKISFLAGLYFDFQNDAFQGAMIGFYQLSNKRVLTTTKYWCNL